MDGENAVGEVVAAGADVAAAVGAGGRGAAVRNWNSSEAMAMLKIMDLLNIDDSSGSGPWETVAEKVGEELNVGARTGAATKEHWQEMKKRVRSACLVQSFEPNAVRPPAPILERISKGDGFVEKEVKDSFVDAGFATEFTAHGKSVFKSFSEAAAKIENKTLRGTMFKLGWFDEESFVAVRKYIWKLDRKSGSSASGAGAEASAAAVEQRNKFTAETEAKAAAAALDKLKRKEREEEEIAEKKEMRVNLSTMSAGFNTLGDKMGHFMAFLATPEGGVNDAAPAAPATIARIGEVENKVEAMGKTLDTMNTSLTGMQSMMQQLLDRK
jgi:hypothetical protein